MSEASAAQQYFDPPDPKEYTYAVTVSFDITATSDEDASKQTNEAMRAAGREITIHDWYVDDLHPYGPEADEDAL